MGEAKSFLAGGATTLLMLLGIEMEPAGFVLAMILGLAVGMLMRAQGAEQKRSEFFLLPPMVGCVALLAAMIHPHYASGLPPILFVAICAAFSPLLFTVAARVSEYLAGQVPRVLEAIIKKALGEKK